MTNLYQIQARCVRSFASWIEIEAETPEEALAKARLEDSELTATAEDSEGWDWDEFAVCDQSGTTLLHMLDDDARLRGAAPALLAALEYALEFLKANDDGEKDVANRIVVASAAIAEATGIAA